MINAVGCNATIGRNAPPVAENAFLNKTEAAVRSQIGTPTSEFAGHFGNPPDTFTLSFTGEVKTLVFEKPGGAHYVSFEKQPAGWVCISSSWLPEGAAY